MIKFADFVRASIWFVGISFILAACGRPPKQEGFEVYINLFQQEAINHNVDVDLSVDVEFSDDVPEGVSAVCKGSRDRVLIKKSKWDKANEMSRRWLIFHELGHCVLLQGHRDGTIMNYKELGSNAFEKNYTALVDELFSHRGE